VLLALARHALRLSALRLQSARRSIRQSDSLLAQRDRAVETHA
jgi:hypothetical protein